MPIKKYATDEERKLARANQRKEYDKRYRMANREKRALQNKEWTKNNKERHREIERRSRINNKNTPTYKARTKRAYWNNKEKHKIRHAVYNKNNKDLLKIYSIRRRQIKKKVFESMSRKSLQEVYFKFNYKCYVCNNENDLCLDHHYPLKLGNPLTANNAVLLCRSCNSIKRDRLPESFYSPEQLTDLQLNYGISKSPIEEKQPSLFEARMPKNLERDNGLFGAMNAA